MSKGKFNGDTQSNAYKFYKAFEKARNGGETRFICPICGNPARWNNDEFKAQAHCTGCGIECKQIGGRI